MARPKKVLTLVEKEIAEEIAVEEAVPASFNESEALTVERTRLLALRDAMTAEGINDISKLDTKIGALNQRLSEL
uniref:Uncharacterized protein n=1 Tax=viral metagenome TaxID=1070528 RepID=A0A6H1ZEA9_9ZZZZ